jgi:membrane protease subunit HflC
MHPRTLGLLALIGAIIIVAADSLFVVDQREIVVIRQFGQFVRSINEPGNDAPGLQVKLPFVQEIVRLDRRVLALDPPVTEVLMGEDTQTAQTQPQEGQPAVANEEADQRPRLVVDSFVRYRITNARDFVITVQNEDRLITLLRPVVDDAVRGVLSRYSLKQLLSEQRGVIMGQIAARVNDVAKNSKYGIEIIDVRIRRADFPDRALQAVFDRMRSERDRVAAQTKAEGEQRAQAIRAAADRERVEIIANAQRESQKTRGEADNEAIRVMGEATSKDTDFYSFYRSLEAYRKALRPDNTTLVLSPDSQFLRYFENRGAAR